MKYGKICEKDEKCPIHFVEGNGGVPNLSGLKADLKECSDLADWCRIYDMEQTGAYGRVTATETSFRYDHVQNSNKKVIDTWTVTKEATKNTPTAPTPPVPPYTPL